MTHAAAQHLSPEDLDDILMGTESAAARVHLETCRSCRELAAADLDVVVRLQKLPHLSPSPGFADRVMTAVTVPGHAPVRLPAPQSSWSWARAAAIAAVIVGGMGSSVVWSLSNQARIDAWRTSLVGAAELWYSTLVPMLVTRLTTSPVISAALASTGRLVAIGTAAALAYLIGLLAMRRLLALPSAVRHAA